MRWFHRIGFVLILASAAPFSVQAGGKDKKEPAKADGDKPFILVVPPAGGKEVKLVDWQFTLGTRHFALSDSAPVNPKAKTPTGPEYLEFREEKSTTYRNGIVTLIPLTSVRKISYDREKKSVFVTALKDDGTDATLIGSTKFASNKITIEADAILDGLGAATVKFNGGIDKGLHSVAFPAPKPADKVKGTPATVTADDKEKTKHAAYDLQALYLSNGQYRALPYVMFKKTVKIDLDKLASLRYVPPTDKKKGSSDYEVTLKDGAKHTLTILTTVEADKKKTMTFVGLLGRVPVGYKLFHLDAIYEYRAGMDEKK